MTKRGNTIHIIIIAALVLLGATRTGTAGSTRELNAAVTATLDRLYYRAPGAHALAARAVGLLVFPTIVKAGFWFGGEYGEGALRMGGRTVAYYNNVAGSFGLQIGAQARSEVIMFMTPEALASFRRTDGWRIGVDGSVAIVTVGAGGSIDTEKVTTPVVGFILDPTGLMGNLTLEGSKISRISR